MMQRLLQRYFLTLSLRKKTLAIVGSTLGALIAVLYVITSLVVRLGFVNVEHELSSGFGEIEQQHAITNVSRVQNAIETRIENLAVKFADWARWDDTYTFVADNNAAYRESNLYEDALAILKINVLLIVNAEGQRVYGNALDLAAGKQAAVPPSLAEYTAKDGYLLRFRSNEDVVKGLLLVPEGPLMVVSRPIIKSDGSGDIRGAFVVGKYLDTAEVAQLSALTRLNVKCYRHDEQNIPADIVSGVSLLNAANPISVLPTSLELISAYTVLHDMFGAKALLIKVEIPREIHRQAGKTLASIKRQGQFILLSLVSSIVLVGIILGKMIFWLLNTSVISRLAGLSNRTGQIGDSGDFAARVMVDGGDEIASLSRSVNAMLETLSQSHHKITRQKEDLERKSLELAEANKKITDSIEYAKRIQSSLLPSTAVIRECLGDSLIFWQPKDIVSGDLFYLQPRPDGFLVVLMDCTGHGVSGAFMTLIAHSALRKIVQDQGCHAPGEVLRRLNSSIKIELCQLEEGSLSNDGLDAAVCLVDQKSRLLRYAGARMPLVWVVNRQINSLSGDRKSVGYVDVDLDYHYQEHVVEVSDSMTVYLYSDGYPDQVGGSGFPLGKKRFHQLLADNSPLPFAEQRQNIVAYLDEYRGERAFYDDISIIGFKL